MKNLKYLLVILLALIMSCSSDDNNDNQEGSTENFRLIKEVTYSVASGGTETLKFAYSNGRVIKENREYQVYSINYESNRISEVLFCSDIAWDADIDNYVCMGEDRLWNSYIYENNRLVQVIGELNQDIITNINYDSQGRVVSEIVEDGNGEDAYYYYDTNGNIERLMLSYQGSSTNRTYEYDGRKNPFYPLWKSYGYYLYDLEFEPYDLVNCFFKENATRVYGNDGELDMEASYIYDEFGYPISCTYTEYLNGGGSRTGSATFTYLE